MKKNTVEKLIERAIALHGNKYDYSIMQYTKREAPIDLICPEHGKFTVLAARRHFEYGQGCPICGISAIKYKQWYTNNRKSQEQFLADAIAVHGDKYDYSLCVYKGGKIKMPIICKIHGVFKQHAENHINAKHGCRKCYDSRRTGQRGVTGYCETFFESYPEKRDVPAIIYVARMQHKNDDFIKIGITTKCSVKGRFYSKTKNGTIITPLIEYQTTLYNAFTKEQHLLTLLEPYRYYPNRKFGGYTECLKINDTVISLLETYFGINIKLR